MLKRTYRTAQIMKNIIKKKGYSEREAWDIVGAILRDIPEDDKPHDFKRRAEMVLSKKEWEAQL